MSQGQRARVAAPQRQVWRRLPVGAVAAVAVLGANAAPAAAAPEPVSRSADAFWRVGDPLDTQVSLTARRAGGTASVFVHVVQSYCDTGRGEKVVRVFSSDQPVRLRNVSFDRRLRLARVRASLSVIGTEHRIAGCIVSNGGATTTSLGSRRVDVYARWRGVGETRQVGPDSFGRSAVATGSVTGIPSTPGPLGRTTTASLRAG